MPANLPPDYYAAEGAYRAASTPQDKRDALERMLAVMPKHKGTDHLRAELRSRMAKLAQEISRQHSAGHADAYAVHREGAGQAALIGLPNAGKSRLLHALTNVEARVAEYPFTTQLPQPAMMPFEDIQVQLVDLPPVAPGATPGWLRGIAEQADLLLLVIDLDTDPPADLEAVIAELAGLHVLPRAPGARARGDAPRRIGSGAAAEGLVAGAAERPALVVGTRLDLPAGPDGAELLRLELADQMPLVSISAVTGDGLEPLRSRIFDALDVVRVYAKPPGRPPESRRPFVLPAGSTVEDLADMIHHEVRQRLQYAVRWPTGGAPVRVSRSYALRDHDVIELHTT